MSLASGVGDAYHRITDSLYNLVSGLGTAKDPRRATHFNYQEIDRNTLEQMYRSDWLARRLVDLPAEDATREWRSWQGSPEALRKIGALERRFELQKKLRMALIRARLYGGGALVLGVDQGQPEDELDFDSIGLGDLKFVVVVNRYELAAGPRIYNVDSPWYTRPEYYTVSTPMFGFHGEEGGAYPQNPKQANAPILPDQGRNVQPGYGMVRIHPSRIIEFSGNELPDWRLAPMGGGWGDSILQTVEDSLKDFAMIMGGLASMINDMKMDVIKVPELSRKLSTAEMTTKTLQRFGLANMAKSSINTLLLDKDEEWNRITTTFGSTPELIRTAMTVACASGGVPESRIMGNAPSHGLSGTGTTGGMVDIRNYYDDITSQQKSKYKPMLTPLDICLQRSATGKFDASVDYVWNPLYLPSPAEKAATALSKAQATQIYVNAGLINENALREATISQLLEDEIYPGLEDAIDEFGSEPEEPPAPPMELPPTPPPGMVAKGQFEANPYHMLRATSAAKAGLPVRVPPNRPSGPPKFAPAPAAKPVKDFDANEPRDETGKWTSGSGGGGGEAGASLVSNYGLVPGDAEKFRALKSEWAKVNNDLLAYIDTPDGAGAQAAMSKLESLVQQMHGLHADSGGVEGIGLPGGPRDVTVVGAGPGGLSAAIFGGAEGLDTLVVEANDVAGGQAKFSSRIENFPGFPIGVTGERLTKDMFEQAGRVGAETKLGNRVTSMSYDPATGMKHLTLSNGEEIDSRAVILAGGLEFRHMAFPGADGPGVVVGDGKKLTELSAGGSAVVVGGSNGAAQAALGAATKADHVYLLSRSPVANGMSDYQISALRNQPKVTVIEGESIGKLNRDAAGNPTSLETTKGQTLPTKALGLFLGSVPETQWLSGTTVQRDKTGRIHTGSNLETGIPGVFAIGDMREGAIGRIGVAVGEGQLALRESYSYLEGLKKRAGQVTDAASEVDTSASRRLISRLFALDRENPWLGQTVEGARDLATYDFNPNHDEKGLFASGGVGGSEAFNAAFADLAKKYPEQMAAHLSKIAKIAEHAGGEGEGEGPAHEAAAKEALEHWKQLGHGIKAVGRMGGWSDLSAKPDDKQLVASAILVAAQAGAFHASGVAVKATVHTVAEHVTEALASLAGGAIGAGVGGALVGGMFGAAVGYAVDKVAEHYGFTPQVAQHLLLVGGKAMSEYYNQKVMPKLAEVEGALKGMRTAEAAKRVSEFHRAHGYADAAAADDDIEKVLAFIAEIRAAVARFDAVVAILQTKDFGKGNLE